MPGQGRLGDKANVPLDAHGCPACPHPGTGPAIQGSPDVNVNRLPALRVDDPGMHAACCGANTWTAAAGSGTVFINGKAAHRMGDATRHCGGIGRLIEGSPNVIVGATSSSGGGGGGGGGDGGRGGGSGTSGSDRGGGSAASNRAAAVQQPMAAQSPATSGQPAATAATVLAASPAASEPPPAVVYAASWERDPSRLAAAIQLFAACSNATGKPATFTVRAADDPDGEPLAILGATCGAEQVQAGWTTPDEAAPDRLVFEVAVGDQRARSQPLSLLVPVEGTVEISGEPAAQLPLVLVASTGAELRGTTDGYGRFRIEDVPAGRFVVKPDEELVLRVTPVEDQER